MIKTAKYEFVCVLKSLCTYKFCILRVQIEIQNNVKFKKILNFDGSRTGLGHS